MTEPSAPHAGFWSPAAANPRRSLLLCACGALLGLILAGIGLFTAKGTRTSAVPAEDIALVNQIPILMSDYLQQLRALYDVSLSEATADQKRQVLDDMIREELYVQRGVELGLQSDVTEVRAALVGAVEQQVAAEASMALPDESALQAFYDQHLPQYATEGVMVLDDYRTGPRSATSPAETVRQLRRDPDAPPQSLGLTPTLAVRGEEFYFAARIHLGEALFEAARRLNSGDVSDPLPAADGTHILVMRRNVAPVPRRYADVRSTVLRDYLAAQTQKLAGGNERFLRRRADIVIARGFE